MYQTSLAAFKSMFVHCIGAALAAAAVAAGGGAAAALEARLGGLRDFLTAHIFNTVCRGLFEEHKLIFSVLIATAIQRDGGAISPAEWTHFLHGGTAAASTAAVASTDGDAARQARASAGAWRQPKGSVEQPLPAWLSQQAWAALRALEANVVAFRGIVAALVAATAGVGVAGGGDAAAASRPPPALAAVLEGREPFEAAGSIELAALWQLYTQYQQQQQQQQQVDAHPAPPSPLTPFQRLLLIRALRHEALPAALESFVASELGPAFCSGCQRGSPTGSSSADSTPSRSENLSNALADSSPSAPIALILAQGADPAAALIRLAESKGRSLGRGLHMVSLGQGQGPVAESLVHLSMRVGDWVCLQVSVLVG